MRRVLGCGAWLTICVASGAAQDSLPPFPGPLRISEFAREVVGTVRGEALRVELAGLTWSLQQRPQDLFFWCQGVELLAVRLRSTAPDAVLAMVQPVLRAAFPRPPVEHAWLLKTLLRAGEAEAIAELEASSIDTLVHLPVETLAEIQGERGVRLLVRMLVRAIEGFEHDDTGHGEMMRATCARALSERGAAERALALSLLEDARPTLPNAIIDPMVLWALANSPTPSSFRASGRRL